MKEVIVPDVGDSQEVTVIEVLVGAGDSVKQDQSIITLETDKATVEIPCTDAGVIVDVKVSVGDKVKEGDVLVSLETSNNVIDRQEEKKNDAGVASNELKQQQHSKDSNEESISKLLDIVIPDIGTDQSVDVIEVHVSQGDTVEKEQSLFTIESDKASVEIPAPLSGVLQSLSISVSDKVKQGDVVGVILCESLSPKKESDTKAIMPASNIHKEKDNPQKGSQNTISRDITNSNCAYAGPGVRRLARDLGVDLSLVKGSGRKNRILKDDLFSYVKSKIGNNTGGSNSSLSEFLGSAPEVDFSKYGEISEHKLSRIKIISGKFLHRNWLSIPHVTHFEEADITDLEDFRKLQKEEAVKQGIRLTPLVFLMRAVVAALKKYPTFNSSLSSQGDKIFLKQYYHIGIAVDTPNGLVVPVIRDVDKKGIFQLAAELGELSLKAREGKLKPQDMQGGCFSISSLGGIGGHAFTPIINAPEVAILGVSRSCHKPIYMNGEFVPRLMLPLSLSYDHRVIDGAEAARFSKYLVDKLSDIRRLLL